MITNIGLTSLVLAATISAHTCPCFESLDYPATLQAACKCLSKTIVGASPSQASGPPSGPILSTGSLLPSEYSPPLATLSSLSYGFPPSKGPITTSSSATIEIVYNTVTTSPVYDRITSGPSSRQIQNTSSVFTVESTTATTICTTCVGPAPGPQTTAATTGISPYNNSIPPGTAPPNNIPESDSPTYRTTSITPSGKHSPLPSRPVFYNTTATFSPSSGATGTTGKTQATGQSGAALPFPESGFSASSGRPPFSSPSKGFAASSGHGPFSTPASGYLLPGTRTPLYGSTGVASTGSHGPFSSPSSVYYLSGTRTLPYGSTGVPSIGSHGPFSSPASGYSATGRVPHTLGSSSLSRPTSLSTKSSGSVHSYPQSTGTRSPVRLYTPTRGTKPLSSHVTGTTIGTAPVISRPSYMPSYSANATSTSSRRPTGSGFNPSGSLRSFSVSTRGTRLVSAAPSSGTGSARMSVSQSGAIYPSGSGVPSPFPSGTAPTFRASYLRRMGRQRAV